MLSIAALLATAFLLEAPGYVDEALRVERRGAWDRSVDALVVRRVGTWTVKADLIATTWEGSSIKTFDVAKCPALQSALADERGPSKFTSRESTVPGVVIIVPDGPSYSGVAKPPYVRMLGTERTSGGYLTPFGQWVESLLKAAETCRTR